jgi:hypothetical protein
MALIGYAWVSTLDPQLRELHAAGCATIHEEQASGADRTRPALARLLPKAVLERAPRRDVKTGCSLSLPACVRLVPTSPLLAMREHTPSGKSKCYHSMVRMVLQRDEGRGLANGS